MSRRLRIAHVLIQPVLMWDDGEDLEAGPPIETVQVRVSDLAGLADDLRAQVAQIEAQQSEQHVPRPPHGMPQWDGLPPMKDSPHA